MSYLKSRLIAVDALLVTIRDFSSGYIFTIPESQAWTFYTSAFRAFNFYYFSFCLIDTRLIIVCSTVIFYSIFSSILVMKISTASTALAAFQLVVYLKAIAYCIMISDFK